MKIKILVLGIGLVSQSIYADCSYNPKLEDCLKLQKSVGNQESYDKACSWFGHEQSCKDLIEKFGMSGDNAETCCSEFKIGVCCDRVPKSKKVEAEIIKPKCKFKKEVCKKGKPCEKIYSCDYNGKIIEHDYETVKMIENGTDYDPMGDIPGLEEYDNFTD